MTDLNNSQPDQIASGTKLKSSPWQIIWNFKELLAVCFLFGILAFIAIAIVLSLIPLYLHKKDVTVRKNDVSFLVTYGTNILREGELSDSSKADLANRIMKQAGLKTVNIQYAKLIASTTNPGKKRRALDDGQAQCGTPSKRMVRAIGSQLVISFTTEYTLVCTAASCQEQFQRNLQSSLTTLTNNNPLPLTFTDGVTVDVVLVLCSISQTESSIPTANPTVTTATETSHLTTPTTTTHTSITTAASSLATTAGIAQTSIASTTTGTAQTSIATTTAGVAQTSIRATTATTTALITVSQTPLPTTAASTTAPQASSTTTSSSSTQTYTAVQSGQFNVSTTWANGRIPSGACSIVIPAGFTVTFTGEILDINVQTLTIAGTFAIASSVNVGFTFMFSINIIVQANGAFQDLTMQHQFYFLAGTICTFYSGASFSGVATEILTYTTLPPSQSIGQSYIFGSSISGPFTFAIVLDGSIQTFTRVTFLTAISGSFTEINTWIGGIVPTQSICALVDGCGLYISPGCVLSTASLNGQLSINFNLIIIAASASFELGSVDFSDGFRFEFAFTFNIYGTLTYLPQNNIGIYLSVSSTFNFFVGASFVSSTSITINIYNPLTNLTIGSGISINSTFSGPYYASISPSGGVTQSTNSRICSPACSSGQTCVDGTCIGVGRLSFTLTWSRPEDGDIVVTTPNGKSIFYANRGPSLATDWGTLDADDRTGTGPENIYWPTSGPNPPSGIYYVCFQPYYFSARPTVSNPVLIAITVKGVSATPLVFNKTVTSKYSFDNTCGTTANGYVASITYTSSSATTTATSQSPQTTTSISSTQTYTAVQSGQFNVSTTWANGRIPSGTCSIIIPAGFTVTFTGEILDINVQTLTIAGTFAIASSVNVGFTFMFSINIIVQASGTFQDLTMQHQFYFLAGTICTFYSGASFSGVATEILTYTTLPASQSIGQSYIFGSSISGPFTFAIVLDGSIQTFTRVTFLTAISGSFTEINTWIGGIIPTQSICALVDGCGLYISPGCVLSTASLNGQLNINFNLIIISASASFELGSVDFSDGFRFEFAFTFNIYGTLTYLPQNTIGIYLSVSSTFNFFVGASFVSSTSITINIYNPLTNLTIGSGISINSTFSGPYYASISASGGVTQSTNSRICSPACSSGQTCVDGTCIGVGRLSFTLTWSRPGDGDIVVTTPNGKSIFYANRGPSLATDWGTLDADDRTGTGPENIYWPTSGPNPPSGIYYVCFQPYYFSALPTVSNPVLIAITVKGVSATPLVFNKTVTSKYNFDNTCGTTANGYVASITYTSSSATTTTTSSSSSQTYTAVQSGQFNVSTTWANGRIPSGACSIVIPAGFTVTFTGEILDINVQTLTIAGTFAIASSVNVGFTFMFSINIIVQANGAFQDLTMQHQFYFLAGTICTFYSGASFSGVATEILTYTTLPASQSIVQSYIFGSSISGPFTFAIVLDGSIQTFARVTFITAISGSFTEINTWIGGIVPTQSICALVDGCGLYISPGCVLSTASLNGRLSINFNLIIISASASFELGSVDFSDGFRFEFAFIFNIYGTLTYLPQNNIGIYLSVSSTFNFFVGASFVSSTSITINIYNPLTNLTIGSGISINSTFSGPYYASISASGGVTQSTNSRICSPACSSGQTCVDGTCIGVGRLSFTLTWSRPGDGDIVVTTPNGKSIFYANRGPSLATDWGTLDADDRTGTGPENIYWPTSGPNPPSGIYYVCFQPYFYSALPTVSNPVLISITVKGVAAGPLLFNKTVTSKYSFDNTCGTTANGYVASITYTSSSAITTTTSSSSSQTYTAVQSGQFNVSTTWANGRIPSGTCSIIIPAGFTVTFTGEILDINVQTLTIAGTFAIASSINVGFTFMFSINIIVQANGAFQDLTMQHQFYFLAGTICTFYSGASFSGVATEILTYTTLPASQSIGQSYIFGSSISGPFTFAILLDGSIQTFTRVTFLTAISGSFTEINTWIGGIVPTQSICALVDGCGLYISPGCVLSTASLNGQLNINFNLIIIAISASFELGAVSSSDGFRFEFALTFSIYGTLTYLPQNNIGIYLSVSSTFNFFLGASFVSSISITINIYNPLTNLTIGSGISINSTFSGPYYASISSSGGVTQSTNSRICSPACSSGQTCVDGTCIGVGRLSFTLTWSRPGDGDIVVTTPNGKSIFYANRGPSLATDWGTLDADDRTGTGPENIYWPTSGPNPPSGTYYVCFQPYYFSALPTVSNPVLISITVKGVSATPLVFNKTVTSKYSFDNTCGTTANGYVASITYTSSSATTTTTSSSSSQTYTAVQSGQFNVSTTWANGRIPSGTCSIIIPAGFTVTFTGEILDINVQTLTIAGTFAIASSVNVGFTFMFSINIIVQANGAFQDLTMQHQFYFLAGTICTFYSGASFSGVATEILTYTTLPASQSIVQSYIFGSSISGPFTFAIVLDGSIQTFTRVTFLTAISGSFTEINTWIGGIVPTQSICALVGGCGLYISPGCVLSTASLNGQLNINFNLIIIAASASFELGAVDFSSGFRFEFAFTFSIYGTLTYLPQNNIGIYLSVSSTFNFFVGASFVSSISITINIYNPLTNLTIGSGISINSTFSGPYYASISASGGVTQSTNSRICSPACSSGQTCVDGTCIGVGRLSFTLTWSRPGDGDIVVTTPNGKSIFYANRGPSLATDWGTLDADDRTGTGPENIYWPTSGPNPPSGIYYVCFQPYYFSALPTVSNPVLIAITVKGVSATPLVFNKTVTSKYSFDNTCGTTANGYVASITYTSSSATTTTTSSSSSQTYTAVQSGQFNVSTTWAHGRIPSGTCSIIIPAGITVTFTGEILDINVQTLTIAGTFVIASSVNVGFTFMFSINIIVQASGAFQDLTMQHQFYFLAGTICTFYSGASFSGVATEILTYTTLPASQSIVQSYIFGSSISGPFTFAIVLDGSIQTFTRVTFLTAISGSFTEINTWIGGIVPTQSICALVGGCGLYISPGCVLSTASLNGQLNINFNLIIIAASASFELGAVDFSSGFRFEFAFTFSIYGTLTYLPQNNIGIYLSVSSTFNFFVGASFVSSISITINIYNPLTNLTIGSGISINSTFSGPYYASISASGGVTQSTNSRICSPACSSGQTCVDGTCIGVGRLSFTLTWSRPGDGDIVVTTPNGKSIFYANRGPSLATDWGTLDADDRTGTGPENIYWPTSGPNPPSGIYYVCFQPYYFSALPTVSNPVLIAITVKGVSATPLVFNKTVTSKYSFDNTCGTTANGYVASITYTSSSATTTTTSSSSSQTYTAVQSGQFNVSTTWAHGRIPSGTCSIIIPAGITVTFTGEILDINVQTLTIAGTFVIASSVNVGFTFMFSINIIVQASGTFQDLTMQHQFYFLAGTICTFYSGASFSGVATEIFTYTTLPASQNLGQSYIFGSSISGPFTFTILLDGSIQIFTSVTFITAVSGSFTEINTWIGGIVPTQSICALVGGCGLYISPGCVLSTASLNGQLNINFNLITIATGGTFELGAVGVSGGFRFGFSLMFNIYGTLRYLSQNSIGFYICVSSELNFFRGATFFSSSLITINIYNPLTNLTIGNGFSISSTLIAPYYVSISATGLVTESANSRICSPACSSGQTCVDGTCVGVGRLSFTLIWSRPGDGDIVVTTPNGKSIYYGNRGPSLSTDWGTLDADDRTGTGPENIYWPETSPNPPSGTYYVCFQPYFYSALPTVSNPVLISITVKGVAAGPLLFNKTVTSKYSFDNTCGTSANGYVASITYAVSSTTVTTTLRPTTITTTTTTTTTATTTPVCVPACAEGKRCVNGVCVGSGFFAFTLTWSRPGDGDIVVTTPNGISIFYANRGPTLASDWGTLDADDRTGTGPENIYWPSTGPNPPSGTYYVCFQPYSFSPDPSASNPIIATATVHRVSSSNLVFTKTISSTFDLPDTCSPSAVGYLGSVNYPS